MFSYPKTRLLLHRGRHLVEGRKKVDRTWSRRYPKVERHTLRRPVLWNEVPVREDSFPHDINKKTGGVDETENTSRTDRDIKTDRNKGIGRHRPGGPSINKIHRWT